MSQRRQRGRPAGGSTGDTRAAILDAARSQFASQGYTGASLRSIAREAGVDASLISHYFGDKSQLLVATMELPVNPIEKITGVVAGGVDGMGERLLRTFLTAWDPHRDAFSALVRTQLASADAQVPMVQLMRDVVTHKVADVLEGDERKLRAALVASQLIGMALARYVVLLDPLPDTSVDDVVGRYAPSLQRLMDG
ncbi:TetR family transcriptional regulator [Aeromicrobium sp.]|uniref:TetR/AcrR family transcriptional regulator n=1 Tax=Aeromicrobium sp. TaxID=1871063 RepID=UPI003D6B5EB4